MSYYSDRNNLYPGPIEGNALEGLQARVAISVRRVLDSCRKQLSLDNTELKLKNIQHELTLPLAFLGATSTQVQAEVSNLQITRLEERPSFARVQCSVTVPLKVTYRNNSGVTGTADGSASVNEDIVMYVPEASVFPFEIIVAASCNSSVGEFIATDTARCTLCMTVITKVVAETDLLVPVYGYCPSPEAIDFEQQFCDRFFDLPLYPSGR
jgi:hypothetical protein